MVFHVTTGASDDARVGTFGTLAEAMATRMLEVVAGSDAPAFIVEIPEGHARGGRLVAGFDSEYGWVQVDPDEAEPDWWHELSDRARRWIVEHPRDDLPAWMVEQAARSGAGAFSAYWVSSGPTGVFTLSIAVQDWALRRRVTEAFGRG